ncbi:MAG: hypothetical protein RLZZ515_1002 [Cyanobacteriota bacterium]|jgi:hypothetical protein
MDAVSGFVGAALKPHWRPGSTGEGLPLLVGPFLCLGLSDRPFQGCRYCRHPLPDPFKGSELNSDPLVP